MSASSSALSPSPLSPSPSSSSSSPSSSSPCVEKEVHCESSIEELIGHLIEEISSAKGRKLREIEDRHRRTCNTEKDRITTSTTSTTCPISKSIITSPGVTHFKDETNFDNQREEDHTDLVTDPPSLLLPPATTTTTTPTTTTTTTTTPTHFHRPPRVVLVPVDGSPASQLSVDWARRFGYILPSDIVILVTVWEEQMELLFSDGHQLTTTTTSSSSSSSSAAGAAATADVNANGNHPSTTTTTTMTTSPSISTTTPETSTTETPSVRLGRGISSIYGRLLGLQHDQIRKHNHEALKHACQIIKDIYKYVISDCDVFPFIVACRNLATGSIGSVICHTADRINANLVIVGSRGYSTIKQIFVGSVSRYVVDHAKVPVLLVKQ